MQSVWPVQTKNEGVFPALVSPTTFSSNQPAAPRAQLASSHDINNQHAPIHTTCWLGVAFVRSLFSRVRGIDCPEMQFNQHSAGVGCSTAKLILNCEFPDEWPAKRLIESSLPGAGCARILFSDALAECAQLWVTEGRSHGQTTAVQSFRAACVLIGNYQRDFREES